MSKFEWRSAKAYNFDHAADPKIAWECLRRNPAYQQDYQSVDDPEACAPSDFRSKWGLVFRS
ncbi:transcriptional regulator domain-containing protein [Bradyrhizobium sp. SZCCHNR2035]|uniref:transcriptional regulator domain-containing protein n=1 Tax=Bradyrhizobium sp. SZCCHNR2035 TaxID=3057386 RepID=UPI0039671DFC